MNEYSLSELRLKSLGIETPDEIDILLIADDMGASVKFRKLKGCEARILGGADKAVISISDELHRVRQRFSIGHELGHWRIHRGRQFECRSEDIGSHKPFDRLDPERVADKYAAELLMPEYIGRPIMEGMEHSHISNSIAFADRFRVSRIAGALRAVEFGRSASYLIYVPSRGNPWKKAHDDLPSGIWLQNNLRAKIQEHSSKFSYKSFTPVFDDNLYNWFNIAYNPDLYGKIQIYSVGNGDFMVTVVCNAKGVANALWSNMKSRR